MSETRRQVIFPAPRYDDAWAAIAYLERCFGFTRQLIHEGANGTVAHGELRLGTASVGLSSAGGPVVPQNPWTSVRSGVYVALPNAAAVGAHHEQARAAGARIAMSVEDTDYGSRQYSVWDVEQHLWCFGTYTHATGDDCSLFLVLRYADTDRARDWLRHTFGFEGVEAERTPATELVELRLGDGRLWLSRAQAGEVPWGDTWHLTHVVVPDVDAHYAHARQAGAAIVAPLADRGRAGRVYYARDVEGYLWAFGSAAPSGVAR